MVEHQRNFVKHFASVKYVCILTSVKIKAIRFSSKVTIETVLSKLKT